VRPRHITDVVAASQGIALVGEAAGWISPSSAEGFSYAFRSAPAVANALQHTPRGFEKRSRERVRTLRCNLLLKHWESRVVFNPSPRKVVMVSGLRSVRLGEP